MKAISKIFSVITAALLCFNITSSASYAEHENTSSASETQKYSQIPVTEFRVGNLSPSTDTNIDYTDWWYSEWEDCRYIFLPASADRNELEIIFNTEDDMPVFLDDIEIHQGEMTDILSKADEFQITVGENDCGTLKIMQSNLGCIYLTTSHGGLDYLDANGWTTETADTLMLDPSGNIEYSGEIEKITSHGNSSWDYSKKKPYNIKLPQKQDLYGMGKAKKWWLISNYLDHSMMRNKITTEISKAAEIDITVDSVFVDLYADGSYRGTYQLCERVQIQKNRIPIMDLEEQTEMCNENELDSYPRKVVGASNVYAYMENSYKFYDIPNDPEDITGGYLLQFQLFNRYGHKASSGFVTSRGQAVELDGPEYATENQVLYIRNFVQELEDAIYSPTGYNSQGKHYSEYIDVDSLIKAYLIQEISMNIDSTTSSFFLWKDSDLRGDGKLHFGPVWDFDLSYHNFNNFVCNSDGKIGWSSNPENLYAAYFPINGYDEDLTDDIGSGRPTYGISWIGQLYKNEEFVQRVAEIYFEYFEPFLYKASSTQQEDDPLIVQMAKEIQPSAEMNNARWHTYGGREFCVLGPPNGDNFMECVDYVRNFIARRSTWLSQLWQPYMDEPFVMCDVNSDGEFNTADIVALQKWLLGSGALANWKAADIYHDDKLDSFDLVLMKQLITSE